MQRQSQYIIMLTSYPRPYLQFCYQSPIYSSTHYVYSAWELWIFATNFVVYVFLVLSFSPYVAFAIHMTTIEELGEILGALNSVFPLDLRLGHYVQILTYP